MLGGGVDPYTHLPLKPYHDSFEPSSENHVLAKRRCKPNEVLTDFLQQQTSPPSSGQKVISSIHDSADNEDVNLELSIALPFFSSAEGTSSNSKEFSSGIRPSKDCIQPGHKVEICCHIGLQTVDGSCCSGCSD
jgi:hypothetical protein